MRLTPEEQREKAELERQAVNGDLLAIPDIRKRVRLRDLRRKAAAGA